MVQGKDEQGQLGAAEKVVEINDGGTSDHFYALRSDQRGVVRMKNAIGKFMSPGQRVADHCVGTLVTVRRCILERYCRRFVGCKAGTICFKESLFWVLKVFPRPTLNEKPEIVTAADAACRANVLVYSFVIIGPTLGETFMGCPVVAVPYPVSSFLHYALPLQWPPRPLV